MSAFYPFREGGGGGPPKADIVCFFYRFSYRMASLGCVSFWHLEAIAHLELFPSCQHRRPVANVARISLRHKIIHLLDDKFKKLLSDGLFYEHKTTQSQDKLKKTKIIPGIV